MPDRRSGHQRKSPGTLPFPMASMTSATMIASPRVSVICQARRTAPLSFHPKVAILAREEGRSMLPTGTGSPSQRPGTLQGRPNRMERSFGGGGFSKTLQLQRNRRRAVLRKMGPRAARQPQVGTVLDEVGPRRVVKSYMKIGLPAVPICPAKWRQRLSVQEL